ncbi:DeoR/GlpR family DNA-binding transcription regulator [Arthrobacter sp. PsM3]|uniref:DeoR/GlpR family DNA-binding transcription regulator n=1 Tax=Arthrobacter sp. PsM3 TaxID=3030531 RepID=UPI00263B3B18|nr:DeoR/GlpR family DNA-binding transcription regulator [Arthrobacter sp. PsM3]MDN4643281.1 DeoR/GlpR family DNA-binding transcription regulator [Arthrobacter sp. PsM3]
MSTEERHRRIGDLLRHREHVTVDELATECGASGATIRRDLDVLELHGVLRRVHGGARSLVLRGGNPEYGQRELEDHTVKVRIATGVAALLEDRGHVWLDSGTTATEVARQLRHRELTLMPMSLRAVNVLAEGCPAAGRRPELLLPGGSLIAGEQSFRGPMTESNIRSLRFDTAVVTPCALNLRDGLLAHDLDDAAVKRAGLESAGRVIVACSGSKWNASAVALVASLDAVDVLVTDRHFSPEELAQLAQHSVEAVIV